ncbi:MAG: hypothetical protein PUH41_02330 [Prevotella sp.]|nr:hypothetical protein [Prevotella sp.]
MKRTGEVFINDLDAFENWGISFTDKSISTLMEPEPLKNPVENKSTTRDGKQIRKEDQPKVDERDLTLAVQLYARNRTELFSRLKSFKTELKKRRIVIRTKYEPGVYYRCDYQSCTQYTSFHRGLATFSLKLNEPNPNNRDKEDLDDYDNTDI